MNELNKNQLLKRKWAASLKPYFFILPIYLLIVVFKYIPFVLAMIKSFFNWNGGNVNEYIGVKNYVDAFLDPVFVSSLGKSLIVVLAYVIISISLPLIVALLIFSLRSGKAQFHVRTSIASTMVVPGMVTTLLWKWIFAGDYGILNQLLALIGLENFQTAWLGNQGSALGSIIAIGFPWLGIAMLGGMPLLVYYGNLQNIPHDLYEQADIDGITLWKRIIHIDLPMLASSLKLMISMAVIQAVQVFDAVYVLTRGGPGTSTMLPAVYLFEQGYGNGKLGYSSAIGIILFLFIMGMTIANNKLLKESETGN